MRNRLGSICFGILVLGMALGYDARGTGRKPEDPTSAPPGTVLSESKRDLGNGYLEIRRSQVNPPAHWEGIGHFTFIYFGERKLCQCDVDEVQISPKGKFALFVPQSGQLTLFNAATKSGKRLTKRYEGMPIAADWQLSQRRVAVTLEKYVDGRSKKSTLTIPL
jgi:hypothetical protein